MKVSITILSLALVLLSCSKGDFKKNGCTSPAKQWDDGTCNYYIGNIFTPNGDGLNDIFIINSSCPISAYSMTVRKGNSTYFSTTDPLIGWDGTKNNNASKDGLYDYTIHGIINGYEFSETGTVTLNRDGASAKINSCSMCSPTQTVSEPVCQTP